MLIPMDDRFRQRCMADGSVLKFRRGKFGTGAVVRMIGVILTFASVAAYLILAGVTVVAGEAASGRLNIYTSAFLMAGILLTFLGYRMRKQQENGYVRYYAEKNQVEETVVLDFDGECAEDGVMLAIPERARKKAETEIAGVITANYVLLPGMYGRIGKIREIAAAFYDGDPKMPGGKHLESGLAYITMDAKRHLVPLKEEYAREIAGELARRNLALYTKKNFTVSGGREVNNFAEPGPVVERYRRQAR